MQSDWKQIYKLTSERTEKAEQTYKDIGNFVFASLAANLRKPKSLIIKLKGVGSWYLRKQRMLTTVNSRVDTAQRTQFDNEEQLREWLERMEIHNLFIARLKDYEEYLKLRDEIRQIRYKTQTILEPPEREE